MILCSDYEEITSNSDLNNKPPTTNNKPPTNPANSV
ncbi:hypothetical protein BN8_02712 [Fibrisoma limi BUZ 3]|uniref:Uncharacterized protein n=1 Tax=Fibrisoma limi BUZ 3 TaxID=1185876 RepID=I2GI79_9BACT|nr:hypothetical protein BN8_02712 [Fibrisoma limi BUZ 3]